MSQALQPTTDDALAAAGDALAEHLIGLGLNVQVSRRLITFDPTAGTRRN